MVAALNNKDIRLNVITLDFADELAEDEDDAERQFKVNKNET